MLIGYLRPEDYKKYLYKGSKFLCVNDEHRSGRNPRKLKYFYKVGRLYEVVRTNADYYEQDNYVGRSICHCHLNQTTNKNSFATLPQSTPTYIPREKQWNAETLFNPPMYFPEGADLENKDVDFSFPVLLPIDILPDEDIFYMQLGGDVTLNDWMLMKRNKDFINEYIGRRREAARNGLY